MIRYLPIRASAPAPAHKAAMNTMIRYMVSSTLLTPLVRIQHQAKRATRPLAYHNNNFHQYRPFGSRCSSLLDGVLNRPPEAQP